MSELDNALDSALDSRGEALRNALAVLNATLESTADGILVVGLEGHVVSHNRRFRELWRLPEGVPLPHTSAGLREMVRDQVVDADGFEARIAWLYEHPEQAIHDTVRCTDGRVFDRYSQPHWLGTEIIGRVWSYRDVTEAAKAAEELKISEERYRIVAETASDGIVTIDERGRILFANTAAARMFGYRREELARMSLRELIPERGEGLRADGTRLSVEVSYGESTVGEERWSTAIIRDVTEARRTARALAASEQRYRSVVENLNEVVFQADRRGRWTFLNPAWAAITGYPVEGSLGRSALVHLHPEDRARNAECFRQLYAGERKSCNHTVRFFTASGEVRNAEISARLTRDEDGKAAGTSGTLADVTERLSFESRLERAREAAEAANRSKTDFLANMSHEIRTPLNAIIGMSELMNSTALSADQRAFQETIWTSAESLLHLINDLLDISKIESGQVDVDSTDFDPEEICEEAARMLRPRLKQKGLSLYCYSRPAMPPRVTGDPNRIRQVLVNLLGNALKFTAEGHVALLLGWSIQRGERVHLTFEVVDTGCGIQPADRERIFEKFVQLDTSNARRFGGAGLGLNISRALAEAMGGALTVDSAPGAGSRFTLDLTLPRAGVRRMEDFVLLDRCRGLRVLALAKVPHNSRFVKQFEAWGAEVSTAYEPGTRYAFAAIEGEGESPAAEVPVLRDALLPHQIREFLSALLGVPLPHSSAAAPAALPPQQAQASRPALLLVEDIADNRELALRILKQGGYRVEVAVNGVEGVEKATAFCYDLILMDLRMPEMDGFDAARAIREHEAAEHRARVPIVALTAHALEEHREQALKGGMDDYVTKPFRRNHLLSVVERWVDRRPKILIADDAPEILRLVEGLLRSAGDFRLVCVSTGAEALREFARQNFSLVLLDLELGDSDGLDVARAMRGQEQGSAVPIVAITGHAGMSIRARCLAAGCTKHIEKPIRRSALMACLDQFVRRTAPAVAVAEDMADLIPPYLASVQEAVDRMLGLAQTGERERIREMAHRLKGSGGGYGFERISQLARAIEGAAASGGDGLAEAIRALDGYLAGVAWKVAAPPASEQ